MDNIIPNDKENKNIYTLQDSQPEILYENNFCNVHTKEFLNFYCDDHKVEICQHCLIEQHMGHKIIKPEESESNKLIIIHKKLNSLENEISERLKTSEENYKKVFGSLNETFDNVTTSTYDLKNFIKFEYYEEYKKLKETLCQIESIGENLVTDFDKIKKTGIRSIDSNLWNENIITLNNLKDKYLQLKIINTDLQTYPFYIQFNNLINHKIDSFLKEFMSTSNNSTVNNKILSDIENPIDYLIDCNVPSTIRYKLTTPLSYRNFVKTCQARCKSTNPNVLNVLQSIDRAEFVIESSFNHAYLDTALSIGWNTTISAPHMHMYTLNYIANFIKNFKICNFKAIDIGSGGGFMTLALSKLLGPYSEATALDHISDIIDFAKSNISKSHAHYIETKRIQFICGDALSPSSYLDGPYHIIHVGAACTKVPELLINLLLPGGMIWIPVGPKNEAKKIMVIIKKENGEIKKESLIDVSYSEMQTVEEQMNI